MTALSKQEINDKYCNTCKRAKQILPRGFVLWGWDADKDYDEKAGEEWLSLHPKKWNRHVQYSWRYDPCELQNRAARNNMPRTPCVDTVDPHTCLTDEEYIATEPEDAEDAS